MATIDSLQIEIQSNSTNAATSINDLAKALKKLNKNGDVSDAVSNLNGLRNSLRLFANIPSSASKIDSLANSLKSLSKIKKIDLGDSLASIKKSMESLGAINVDNVAPQIERIAGALGPLSEVKGGGFKSMMDGLKKLGDVTANLSDEAIDAFVAKVKELDTKLGPLSTKMFAVSNAFNVVNSSSRSAGNGMNGFRKNVSVTALNLTNFIDVAKSAFIALRPIVNLLKKTIGDAIEWDGIEYQFGNAFGEQADEYYEKITEITNALNINKQTFMENSAMAASMLKGFGVSSADARTMGVGYTELAYDIWAAYNNVYKSLDGADGAMAAVRSAIAGEVEPIRRAGFTIVESQLKITAANHNIAYSAEKATEAQKSYLRYLTLVDQATAKGIVGTYASEMDTAEGTIRTFRQQLTSLSQAFGSLFLPILVKVMPWLQAFVELLNDAIIAIANFFGVDIQKVDFSDSMGGWSDSSDSATESINGTTSALKELKDATLGIDELNIISPPTPSGGGNAGSGAGYDGLDVNELWDKSIYDSIQTQIDAIKEKIKEMIPTISLLGVALGGLTVAKLMTDLDGVAQKMKGLGKGLSVASIAITVGALVWDFTGAYLEDGNWASFFSALGTTVIGAGLAYKFAGKGGLGFVLAVSGIAALGRLAFELSEGTVDFGDPETWVTLVTGGIETAIGGALTWKAIGPTVKKIFSSFMTSIGTWATTGGGATLASALSAAGPWVAVAAAVVGTIALAFVDYDFTEIGEKIGSALGKALKWSITYLSPIGWGKMFFDWLKEELDVETIKEVIAALFKKETWTDIIFPKIEEIFISIKEWFGDKVENLKENVNEFFGGFFNGFFDELGIDTTFAEQLGDFFDVDFSDLIVAGFSPATLGNEISEAIKGGIKSTGIKDKLSTAWANAKSWWDKNKSSLSTYTPSIGDIKSKLSSAWTTAKNWWSKNKGSLSYTPVIGSIKDKLVSAWNSAKTWWNKNVKLSIPSLSFKVTYTTKGLNGIQKAIVNALGLNGWPKLSFAANGGIFDSGSMIWAGESGAEIVANAGGGKTGVMNVQQMSEAVYDGVYSAVVAAMKNSGNSGGSQEVNVYLDGKQIYSSMEQHRKERGASLMGGQVYAY